MSARQGTYGRFSRTGYNLWVQSVGFLLCVVAALAGCAANKSAPVTDAGADARADVGASSGDAADTPDGGPVYCSVMCGVVASADASGVGQVIECSAGQICGENGVPGFQCCSPQDCEPGLPLGGGCP